MGQLRQFGGGHARGETLNAVIARVHPHDQTAARADGGLVVTGVGAVGGADFNELHPGAGHDVGNAKRPADFDQFAPGDDAFLACAQTVEGQQHGGGIVVDHRHRFGAGQFADQAFDQIVTVAALAAVQVEFQIERIARRQLHSVYRLLGQQRSPEVGVQHGASEVEHPAHMTAVLAVQALAGPTREHLRADFNRLNQPELYGFTQFIEQLPQRRQQRIAPVALGQRLTRGVTQQTVNGRQPQVLAGTAGGHLALQKSNDCRARV